MAEQSRQNENKVNSERSKKRIRPIFIILSVLAFCCFLWEHFFYKSPYEKLTAIEAARAIPDSENAATMYYKFLGYNRSLFEYDFQSKTVEDATLAKPWSDKDYPKLAEWFERHQDITDELLELSRIEQCRFPLTDFPKGSGKHGERLRAFRTWTFFLVRAANNDIAEGRIEQALEKCFCLIRIGRHNRQQPFSLDFSIGITIESMGLKRMRNCILDSDVTEVNLRAIETTISQPNSEWKQDMENMLAVEQLYVKILPYAPHGSGWRSRLTAWRQKGQDQQEKIDRVKEIYTQLLADRRGNQILIALRRFKNDRGKWPESLEELLSSVDNNLLIDPQNNGPFVYKLTDDGFIMYSKGPNNIDEGGSEKNSADDRAIWPLKIPQTDEKNTVKE
jgi:hypothetical protein